MSSNLFVNKVTYKLRTCTSTLSCAGLKDLRNISWSIVILLFGLVNNLRLLLNIWSFDVVQSIDQLRFNIWHCLQHMHSCMYIYIQSKTQVHKPIPCLLCMKTDALSHTQQSFCIQKYQLKCKTECTCLQTDAHMNSNGCTFINLFLQKF